MCPVHRGSALCCCYTLQVYMLYIFFSHLYYMVSVVAYIVFEFMYVLASLSKIYGDGGTSLSKKFC